MSNSPYAVPSNYMKDSHLLYLPSVTGEHWFWDDDGYPCNIFNLSHGRLDAPDEIPSGSMIPVLSYDYPWDCYIFLPSVTVRGE